jgi:Pentapeptide repeats (8 copies)
MFRERDRRARARATLVAAILGLVVLAFLFYELPRVLVTADEVPAAAKRLELRNGVRTAVAQLLAGIVLALGLVYTARTFRVTREGQITERFSKAIEQLGDDKLDIRLGGIFALERIARDSARDHGPVVEVLTAFARRYVRTSNDPVNEAPPDVQAIARVLGRREVGHDPPGFQLDLSGADLRFVDLRNAQLQGVRLAGARLDSADLTNASFREADLVNARLDAATIAGTDFTGADLGGATFRQALFDSRTKWSPSFDVAASGALVVPEDLR